MIRSGREVSRIEGFSDAVFGFALTLLVVSLEVPANFEELKDTLRGFVPFAATFALVCWIWYEHYAFFRRFDADDGVTLTLNCALLFLVLFFVYPLKFVFAGVIPQLLGMDGQRMDMPADDARLLMWVYSAGFVAMMMVFVLLHWNQYYHRAELKLSREQAFDALMGTRMHLISVFVGLLSIRLALTAPMEWFWTAGAIYAFQGPLHAVNGIMTGRAREQLRSARGDAR